MHKRSSTPKDINQIAASLVQHVEAVTSQAQPEKPAKNPAAVALGRLGGLKGGKARAASLTASQRKAIAKKAAEKRWNKS